MYQIMIQSVIMGLLIAAVFAGSSQADTDTRVALTTASYLTFVVTMTGSVFADTLGSILEHANVYAEQRSQGMVRALPYFIAKSLVVLLPYFVRPLRTSNTTVLQAQACTPRTSQYAPQITRTFTLTYYTIPYRTMPHCRFAST